jgi:alanine-glyoxylate transaminase/serine-glyoxylate transaminase/serine-pyruvate transaminase
MWRHGVKVDILEFEWGTPVIPEAVADKLKGSKYKLVAVVHAETSTGACNPIADIGGIVAGTDSLYLVDTVTSLGGIPVEMDKWNVDICYSGTQKCISCPPGISSISFSDRAVEAIMKRSRKVPNGYTIIQLPSTCSMAFIRRWSLLGGAGKCLRKACRKPQATCERS